MKTPSLVLLNGNAYVTGYDVETSIGFDIITIQYSPNGVENWVCR